MPRCEGDLAADQKKQYAVLTCYGTARPFIFSHLKENRSSQIRGIDSFDFPFSGQSAITEITPLHAGRSRPDFILENVMTKQSSRRRTTHASSRRRTELQRALDLFLAVDQGVVEFSMDIYNLSRRERMAMRKQNRRLHHALREQLPQLFQPTRIFLQAPST